MTIVTLPSGQLEGFVQEGIHTFLGVPYAAPVTPARRFLPPQDVEPWQGIRAARVLGDICPQIATHGPVGHGAAVIQSGGDDYLTVNIRTPSLDGAAPVLVWLHGGGYAAGSANIPVLQTGAFAASGVVEVTVNYRLGVLGFLDLGDGSPANRGLLDQIKALEWVRDTIAAFGGDPARVTLAGRSAGGFSVTTLMAMPAAHGLFAGALIQSGASPAVSSPQDAARVRERFLAAADCGIADLGTLPLDRLLQAQKLICDESYTDHDAARDGHVAMLGVALQPVLGPDLPEMPEVAAAAGRTAAVPVMIGCTSAEYLTHSTVHADLDFDDAARLLDQRVRPAGLTGAQIVQRYRAALPEHDGMGIWRAVAGDLVFQNPTTRFARLVGRHQPVFKYLYGRGEVNETGEAHGAEVGSVWFRDTDSTQALPSRFTPRDPVLARAIHAIWLSFIRDGKPSLPGVAVWPTYGEGEHDIALLSLDGLTSGADPFAGRPDLWEPDYSSALRHYGAPDAAP